MKRGLSFCKRENESGMCMERDVIEGRKDEREGGREKMCERDEGKQGGRYIGRREGGMEGGR